MIDDTSKDLCVWRLIFYKPRGAPKSVPPALPIAKTMIKIKWAFLLRFVESMDIGIVLFLYWRLMAFTSLRARSLFTRTVVTPRAQQLLNDNCQETLNECMSVSQLSSRVQGSKQGCQIESVSIRLDFRSRSFRNLSIRFKKRFDSIQNYISSHKRKSAIRKNANFQKDFAIWRHNYLTIPFNSVLWILGFFLCRNLRFFMFRFLSRWNRIKSYRKSKKSFDLDTIRFDLSKNIRFDNTIRFDFDSIWQPWFKVARLFNFAWIILFHRTVRTGTIRTTFGRTVKCLWEQNADCTPLVHRSQKRRSIFRLKHVRKYNGLAATTNFQIQWDSLDALAIVTTDYYLSSPLLNYFLNVQVFTSYLSHSSFILSYI